MDPLLERVVDLANDEHSGYVQIAKGMSGWWTISFGNPNIARDTAATFEGKSFEECALHALLAAEQRRAPQPTPLINELALRPSMSGANQVSPDRSMLVKRR